MNKILILLFLNFALVSSCLALDENHYQEQYLENITPLIKRMGEGFFTGERNIKIHYRTYFQTGAKNCLVILPGRSEPVEKYAEVVYDLGRTMAGANLNFYLMDHRGQGSSGRLTTPSDIGHVDHFQNYVKDLDTFVHNMDLDNHCEKKFLLAHSMGAGIATAFILEHPDYFTRVALSSPMLKLITKPFAYKVARIIVETSTLAGRGAKFALKQSPFNPAGKFEDNTFTTSPERYKMVMSVFETYPLTKLGGVSNRWILETMKTTNSLRSRYHEISVPLRIYHAGLESYTEPGEMVKLCVEAINCQRAFFPTSKHEVLMDRDVNRSVVLNSLSEFFN